MFNLFRRRCDCAALLESKLREIDALISERQTIRNEHADLRATLTRIRRGVEVLEGKLQLAEGYLNDANELASRCQSVAALSNDAQAARYVELKKRIDAFDLIFSQLGIFVSRVVSPSAVAVAPADPQQSG